MRHIPHIAVFLFIFLILIIANISIKKAYAQTTYSQTFGPYCATSIAGGVPLSTSVESTNMCAYEIYKQSDCSRANTFCRLNPFCTVDTGYGCCKIVLKDDNAGCEQTEAHLSSGTGQSGCLIEGSFRCFLNPPTPTPTLTPTPTISCVQIPGAFAYNQCTSCNQSTNYYYNCDGSVYSFGSQSDPTCSSLCVVTPTPTPIGPTPTPTPAPFSCTGAIGIYNYSCSVDASCTGGFISGYNPDTNCASQGQTCCFFPSSIPTLPPPPTPTATPIPTPTPFCSVGTIYTISGTVHKSNGQAPGKTVTLCLDPAGTTACTSGTFAYTNPQGAYSFLNVAGGSYNDFLAPSSLPANYSVSSTNPVNVSSNTCPAKIDFTISTAAAPTPTL